MIAAPINATLYRSNDFRQYLTTLFKYHPCPLCGTVHDFHNHGQISRLIRDNTSYENVCISIFVLFCPISKYAKRQYTKRMMPSFVIPECNITLENSMQLAEQFPQKPIDYDKACQILGTYCEATVKRHYQLIMEVLQEAVTFLMIWLAAHPLVSVLPTTTPGTSIFRFFFNTYEALLTSLEKLSGQTDRIPPVIFIPAYVLLLNKARGSLSIPSDLNYLIHFFFDTS